jgi:hypothetical protein
VIVVVKTRANVDSDGGGKDEVAEVESTLVRLKPTLRQSAIISNIVSS